MVGLQTGPSVRRLAGGSCARNVIDERIARSSPRDETNEHKDDDRHNERDQTLAASHHV